MTIHNVRHDEEYFSSEERHSRHIAGPDDVLYTGDNIHTLPVPADEFRPGVWVDDTVRDPHRTPTGTEGGGFRMETVVPSADVRGQEGRSIRDPERGE